MAVPTNPIHSKCRRVHIPQSLLEELYTNQSMSTKKLSEYFHCSQDTIYRRLRAYHIPIRSRSYRAPKVSSPIAIVKDHPKRGHYPIEELAYLYTISHLSTQAIARMYQSTPATIASYLKQAGIKLRGNSYHLPRYEICAAYGRGETIKSISQTYKVAYHTIRAILVQSGHYKKAKSIKQYAKDIYKQYYTEKMTIIELSIKYNCHRETIRRTIKKYEQSLRT